MTESPIPEVAHLRALLEQLPRKSGESAMAVVLGTYAEVSGASGSDFELLSLLYGSLNKLPSLIEDKFPQKGRRAAALEIVGQIKENISPNKLIRPYAEFYAAYGRNLQRQLEILPILEDIEYGNDRLSNETVNIVAEIDKIRVAIESDDRLPDASRKFLVAQTALMERAILRFQTTGVGPFRDEIFTSIGKVYVELAKDDINGDVRQEMIDKFLRIYGLAQAGGDLLRLAGPVISGLLLGPSAVP